VAGARDVIGHMTRLSAAGCRRRGWAEWSVSEAAAESRDEAMNW